MALIIKESLKPHIPMSVQSALSKMSNDEQAIFEMEFEKKKRSTIIMVILAILLPIQLLFLNKVGLWFLFAITFGGFFIWWIIEIFLTPKRTREYNGDIAAKILTNLKMVSQ